MGVVQDQIKDQLEPLVAGFQNQLEPLVAEFHKLGLASQLGVGFVAFIILSVVLNVAKQILFANPNEPPVVFHWFPLIGSTVAYGIDPPRWMEKMRAKHGDVFTFILLGKKTTAAVGTMGNDFILNGKLRDVNAEEIYTVLTTPVFGKDVVYDCPNAKLMEQKRVRIPVPPYHKHQAGDPLRL